jgi:hypothetical protein
MDSLSFSGLARPRGARPAVQMTYRQRFQWYGKAGVVSVLAAGNGAVLAGRAPIFLLPR